MSGEPCNSHWDLQSFVLGAGVLVGPHAVLFSVPIGTSTMSHPSSSGYSHVLVLFHDCTVDDEAVGQGRLRFLRFVLVVLLFGLDVLLLGLFFIRGCRAVFQGLDALADDR